jgi:type I restriction enzyme S subunit
VSIFCKKIQNGGTPKRDNPEYWEGGNIPWLTSGEVRESVIVDVKSTITEEGLKGSSAKYVDKYSTLVAMYGATAGQVSITSKKLTTNQAVCSLLPKPHQEFLVYLNLRNNIQYLESQARGSAQQNISKGIIEKIQVLNGAEQLMKKFNSIVTLYFEQIINNKNVNNYLIDTRDTLLPKLISGEVRVPNSLQL